MKSLLQKSLLLVCMSLFVSNVFSGTTQGDEGKSTATQDAKKEKGCNCEAKKNSKNSEEQESKQ